MSVEVMKYFSLGLLIEKASFAHTMSQTAHQCSSALSWVEDLQTFP